MKFVLYILVNIHLAWGVGVGVGVDTLYILFRRREG
jgi:hypothetical protein